MILIKKMKKTIILALFASLMAVSCSQNTESGVGFINLGVSSDESVVEVKSSVSDFTTLPSADDFTLVLSDQEGTEIYSGPLKNYSSTTAVKAGNYTALAYYGSSSQEGFEKPYFSGSVSFTVAQGTTSDVIVPVSLANSIVKLAFSSVFTSYYTDYDFTLKTGAGTEISFPKTETRAAFIDAYSFTLSGTLTSQGGKTQAFSASYKNLEAKKCYTVSFDASNVGNGTITITFDDTVEDVQLEDIDLNE